MQMKSVALALTVAAAALTGQAFAQDRVVIHRDTPNGVVTKKIVRDENGNVRRVVVHRPDGTTVIRHRGHHYTDWRDRDNVRMHRTVVIHRRDVPMRHVVVREGYGHRPDYVVNRHVTVVHNRY